MALHETLKAISDSSRRKILSLLKERRMSAGEIVEEFDMSGAAVSKHLSILKDAGLVRDEREGKYIYYEINTSVFEEVLCWVKEIQGEKGGNEDD